MDYTPRYRKRNKFKRGPRIPPSPAIKKTLVVPALAIKKTLVIPAPAKPANKEEPGEQHTITN